MALADLLRSLDEDAARELAETVADQQRRSAEILADARARADTLLAESAAQARADAALEAEARRAAARAQVRHATDDAVEAELAGLHQAVQQRLAELIGSQLGDVSTRILLAEALAALPCARRIRVHPAHAAVVRAAAPELEIVADLDSLGVELSDDTGRSLVNTAPVRFAHLWERKRAALARLWQEVP